MRVAVTLTHNCNLSCSYCYTGRKFKRDISLDTARRIVDFILTMAPAGRRINFGFFGGEPLLRFDLIEKIVRYIREKEEETKHLVTLSVTSNGTLIDEDVLDYLRKEKVDLCISIDGPENVHNLHRRYPNGQGSFDDVVDNLVLALERLDAVQVNAVFGPETIDSLPETVSFFVHLGASSIHLNPDICASWNPTAYGKLRDVYKEVVNRYIESYRQKREIAVNLIDSKVIVLLKDGYTAEDRCGMGETEWGFAPSGNVYPCERLIGEDNGQLCLGNVRTGIDPASRCALLAQRGNRNEECVTCGLKQYCMNWCGCTNHHMTGYTDLASPMMCESEKAAVEAARCVLDTLKDDDLFIDHFMKYLCEGHYSFR